MYLTRRQRQMLDCIETFIRDHGYSPTLDEIGEEMGLSSLATVHKHLQNWTVGLHGVGTWHGAGPVMAQKIMLQRVIDYEHEKNLVKQTLNLKEKGGTRSTG